MKKQTNNANEYEGGGMWLARESNGGMAGARRISFPIAPPCEVSVTNLTAGDAWAADGMGAGERVRQAHALRRSPLD